MADKQALAFGGGSSIMTGVKQVRVLRNMIGWTIGCALVLWLVPVRLAEHWLAILCGLTAGGLYAVWYWRRLTRRITRRDRRFARNIIFVHYLSAAEVLLSAMAYHLYLAIAMGLVLMGSVLLLALSGGWWAVMVGSFGFTGGAVLAGCIIRYERRHGALRYQYDSRTWSGAEGMLYRPATVVKPLTPAGKVDYQGELWNAVSVSGEPIDVGERVEVVSVERLTLYVDRALRPGDSIAKA